MARTHVLLNSDSDETPFHADINVAAIVKEISVQKRFDLRTESCDVAPISWPDMMSICADDSLSLSELSGTNDGDDNAESFPTTGSNCSVFDLRQTIVKKLTEQISRYKKNDSKMYTSLRGMVI